MLSIINLTTTAVLTTVENKTPNVSNLVKKADYDAEINNIKHKYFNTTDYNKFKNNILDAKITAKKWVNRSGLNEKIKTLATKEKVKKLATKAELKVEQDEIVRLQPYDLSLFIGQSYFVSDGAQLYLIIQLLYYTSKRLGDTEKVVSWNSKGLSAENLLLQPLLKIVFLHRLNGTKIQFFSLIFEESCLKQKSPTFIPPNIIDFFIVYELDTWSEDLNSDFALNNCLFGGVKLDKNVYPDKYVYSVYGIGFDSRLLTDSCVGKNVITFGVDMRSYVHIDNKKKGALFFGKGPAQG